MLKCIYIKEIILKKYLAILALVIVAVLVGAVLFYGNDYKHEDKPVIYGL
ncbi:hypothetical protein EMGBS12_11000 [Methylophilaceae bacterium]|nr:hypothetical protein EMGBS12_11000 [Methylophilaceae bacterium]